MRIYQVNIEHKTMGRNWRSEKYGVTSFEKAVERAKKGLKSFELIESVELITSVD